MTPLLHFLIGAAGYFAMGKLGLLLAIPPGFASSIWPAAGFALAMGLLLRHNAVTFGIGLGSFLLNLGVTAEELSNLSATQVVVPLIIAIGAMLQLRVLMWLYRLHLGDHIIPDQPKQIGALLFFVAPLGCLVGASFGAISLFSNGIIPFDALLFTWFTWWTGDTIGTLLFAPLLLVLFTSPDKLTTKRKLQVALPVAGVFAAIVFFFFTSIDNRRHEANLSAQNSADHLFAEIDKRFQLALSRLDAFKAFYFASENVSEEAFQRFFKHTLAGDQTLRAVGWTEIVPHAQREQVETAMRAKYPYFEFKEPGPDGRFIAAAERDIYYPVLFIYPLADNIAAHGLDLGFEQSRLYALRTAKSQKQAVATAPIQLVNDPVDQRGFIIYSPVFKSQADASDERFIGYLSGVFRATDMLQDLLDQARSEGFAVSIEDLSTNADNRFLIELSPEEFNNLSPLRYEQVFELGQRDYRITLQATNKLSALGKDWNTWWVMTAGVLFTILLQALILTITGNVKAIERQVTIKTRELEAALTKADEASQAKSDFLSNISHELRTPLNAIINLVRMSLRSYTLHDARNYLQQADRAAETLLSLINHTLDFSKIEAGQLELDRHPFKLNVMLEQLYAIFSTNAREKGIAFKLAVPEAFPNELVGDALRIEQVLLNFCSNAVKFTETGNVTLEVHIAEFDNGQIEFTFTIHDTGVGMSDEQQKRLFQPFVQGDTSTTRKFGGTGLGLSISRQLIELMQGNLELQSEENVGTQIKVTLTLDKVINSAIMKRDELLERLQPRKHLMQSIQPTIPEPPSPPSDEEKPLQGLKVLVVEDVSTNQLIAKYLLEEVGAEVMIAQDGQHALDKVAAGYLPDVVLMDIQMPVMDGYEATEKLRQQYDPATLPIIALSANAMQHDVEKCLASGMNDHIAKPVEQSVMVAKIQQALTKE
ncbi:MAG: CHASE domain-containing protein [Oleiphilaceae bacterium]|nr:CHASE domain-containing protein [Oleiphilaceae bacterium]